MVGPPIFGDLSYTRASRVVGGREPSARGLTPTQTPFTTRKLRVSTLEFPAAPGGRNQPLAVRPSTALPILEPKWLRLRRTHLGPHVAPKGSLGREASLPENAVSTNVEQGGTGRNPGKFRMTEPQQE